MNQSSKTVKPQKLSGFRDFFAADMQIREYVTNVFKKVFEKYGYEPLETPALEYTEIFSGELGQEAEKLFYRFTDNGGRDVMLKYEVMISMCRAVAENINSLTFPYKRYQIQKVWRAERPQKGRFREFTQCDADTIGSDSILCDAEFIQMGIEVLQKLGFNDFKANISNRKLLNGIIRYSGAMEKQFIPICLSIDKLPKIGSQEVRRELLEQRKISSAMADKILKIITYEDTTENLIKRFKDELKDIPIAQEGINELEQIFNYFQTVDIPEQYYQFSPFIARGLAYYTGLIWEFEIADGKVGSVAGCGRYDNTIGRFLGRKVPATGGSFGIERIIEVIKDNKLINIAPTATQVLVTLFDQQTVKESLKLANKLRQNNISTMLYPTAEKLDKQLKYADKKGIPIVLILGPEEIKNNEVTVKWMKEKRQDKIKNEELMDKILDTTDSN